MPQIKLTLFCIALLGLFAGCSGSDDENSGLAAQVTSLELNDNLIFVGDGTVLETAFSFSSSLVFDDNVNVEVVVRIPEGAEFRGGTAEIQVPAADNDVGAQIFNCTDTGEQFLVFDLDENELLLAENPSGDADAELTLTIDAISAGTDLPIQAAASSSGVRFTCGEPLAFDQQTFLTIVAPL